VRIEITLLKRRRRIGLKLAPKELSIFFKTSKLGLEVLLKKKKCTTLVLSVIALFLF
jgi:fumarate reductase subunit C